MKKLALVLPLAAPGIFLVSCVNAHGPGWSITALGTDAAEIEAAASGFKAKEMNNSNALKDLTTKIASIFKNYLWSHALQFIGGRYFDHAGKIVAKDQAIALEQLRNARSEAEAKAALDQLRFLESTKTAAN